LSGPPLVVVVVVAVVAVIAAVAAGAVDPGIIVGGTCVVPNIFFFSCFLVRGAVTFFFGTNVLHLLGSTSSPS